MELYYILFIVFFGLALIILELIIIPGSSIIGFLGFGITILGIYLGYRYHGLVTATAIGGASILISGVTLYIAIKMKVWKKFSLNSHIEGTAALNINEFIKVGDEGIALSDLRPYGKAEFADKEYEVASLGNFIEANVGLRVLKLEGQKIFVESLKK